ncbi:MAG TPA: hypothetical protein VGJ81_15760 [Thermoanaerobaculia bacterium]|jgi:hypothetical protein
MTTMRRLLLGSLLAVLPVISQAQCVNAVTMNQGDIGGHIYVVLDTRPSCGQATNINKGDSLTVMSSQKQVSGTVASIRTVNQGSVQLMQVDAVAGAPAADDAASLEAFPSGTGTVTYNGTTVNAQVLNGIAVNTKRYTWSVGPASQADNGSAATASATTSALRLQYNGEFIQSGFFGRTTSAAKFETRATASIDTTTTNKAGFIDDNEVTFGLRSLQMKLPGLNQVHFGIQGELTKAAHQDLHDGMVTATFSTWVPEVPAITILSSVPDYVAPPLTIDLSYGYKSKETATDNLHGRGGDGTVAYRLYVWDKYEVRASEKWTLNDFSNRAATVPRTQRMFQVQISYLENPATGFKVAASYQNGSVGPVLTKVKEFFLGVAIAKFSFSGSSSSTSKP